MSKEFNEALSDPERKGGGGILGSVVSADAFITGQAVSLEINTDNLESLVQKTNELLKNMQDILTVQVSKLEDLDVSMDGNTAVVAAAAGGSLSGSDIEAAQTTYGRAAPLSITTTKKDTPEKAPEKEDLKENKRVEIDYCDLEKVVIEELKTALLEFYNDVER